MNKSSRFAVGAAVLCVVAAVGLFFFWLTSGGPAPKPVPDTVEIGPADSAKPASTAPVAPPRTRPQPPQPNQVTVTAPAEVDTNWESRVENILSSETEDIPTKAKQMLEIFPHVPEESKPEVAEHLANLTPDEMYQGVGDLFADPKQPPEILEVFMHDILNRPNSVKLPELLRVAQAPEHPKAGEAREVLTLFLEEDYGSDWQKWQTATDSWLQNNPD